MALETQRAVTWRESGAGITEALLLSGGINCFSCDFTVTLTLLNKPSLPIPPKLPVYLGNSG